MDTELRSEAAQYAKQALADSNREWYVRVVTALDERDAEIERLRAALKPFAELGRKLDDAPNLIGLLNESDWKNAVEAYGDEQSVPEKKP